MKKKLIFSLLIIIAIGAMCALKGYNMLFGKKIKLDDKKVVLYINEDDNYNKVFSLLCDSLDISNPQLLDWVAKKKSYPSLIKPGRYLFSGNMSYVDLINKLRSGEQSPIDVTFNNVRTFNDLAGKVGGKIAADSVEILTFLNDESNYIRDGFTKETVMAVFIPNTYQMYWNTSAKGFYDRMLTEYKKFWNDSRLEKAASINLTPIEVSTLASIVDEEVTIREEKPRVAGVYLNRLRIGMLLQACPTIRFALNDFTITRVLNKHLTVESPYNTYKYKGLPPGPICCPSIEGIDAVLNAEKHDYLFFVAKPDFSGYNNYSRTLSEHNRYADAYHKELDRRRIFK